jgi:hypothetical protein
MSRGIDRPYFEALTGKPGPRFWHERVCAFLRFFAYFALDSFSALFGKFRKQGANADEADASKYRDFAMPAG